MKKHQFDAHTHTIHFNIKMDSSTITFFATLAVAFVFLRWFISPDLPGATQSRESPSSSSSNSSQTSSTTTAVTAANGGLQRRGHRRPVNEDMIEVVKTLAPHLTNSQIRYDLENTGSVSATVENYLANGSLPYPPGEEPAPIHATSDGGDEKVQTFQSKPINLIEKYNLQEQVKTMSMTDDNDDDDKLDEDKSRDFDFNKRREQMILKARKNLQKKLLSQTI